MRKSLLRWKWVFWPGWVLGRSACHVRIPVPHFAPSLAAFFACAMRDESYWVLNLVPGPDPECSLCDKTGADCAPTILKTVVCTCVCIYGGWRHYFRFQRQIDQLIGNYTRGHISFCGDAFSASAFVYWARPRAWLLSFRLKAERREKSSNTCGKLIYLIASGHGARRELSSAHESDAAHPPRLHKYTCTRVGSTNSGFGAIFLR